MRRIILVFILLFVSNPLLFTQQNDGYRKNKPFSLYFDSPILFNTWFKDVNSKILTLDLEYLITDSHNTKVAISAGYGREFWLGTPYSEMVISSEFKMLIGRKSHFFETGTGFYYICCYPILRFRLGYRLNLGDNFLFRIAYTPYINLKPLYNDDDEKYFYTANDISISLGYRFGIHIPKETWNTKFKRLYGLQFDFQPLFQNYKGGKGYNLNLFLEILIHKTEKLLLTSGLGFGYGNSYRHKGSFSYTSLPVGFTMLYGNKTHFAEAGIKASWIPVGGNKEGTYFTLQPEIGYRIHLWKRFMARVAYTPYWWLADKKGREYIEKNFVNSVTVGIGVRFH